MGVGVFYYILKENGLDLHAASRDTHGILKEKTTRGREAPHSAFISERLKRSPEISI